MEGVLRQIAALDKKPKLLLHSCCAPCSSAVLERIADHFELIVFYYNPNIEPAEECRVRFQELQKLIRLTGREGEISLIEGAYENDRFHEAVRGLEHLPEGGERCTRCFELRLGRTAETARDMGMDYIATTLTISPLKDAERLNAIGSRAARTCGVKWLWSDFKKKDGYRRSCELSREYGLYRQDYCGCIYSRAQRHDTATGGMGK
ncbi:MAG: epoxyqueuosine reductase QueH [Clostridiales bacterium]|nr:epoxyqueuosine reductase QueH [Clostridiales bacterium]